MQSGSYNCVRTVFKQNSHKAQFSEVVIFENNFSWESGLVTLNAGGEPLGGHTAANTLDHRGILPCHHQTHKAPRWNDRYMCTQGRQDEVHKQIGVRQKTNRPAHVGPCKSS